MVRVLHVLPASLSIGEIRQVRYVLAEQPGAVVLSLDRNSTNRTVLRSHLPDVQFCGRSGRYDVTLVPRLAACLRKQRPDVVHCWGGHVDNLLPLANRLSVNSPIVVSTATGDGLSDRTLRNSQFRFVASTEEVADRLRRRRVPHQRISVVQKGTACVETPPSVRSLQSELNLPAATKFFGVVSDLGPGNRVTDAMWGFDLWSVIRSELHLVVLGDNAGLEELDAFRALMSAGDSVHFCKIGNEPLHRWLSQLVGVWHPGTGDCSLLLEAMASGVPVIAAECPESRAMVEDGKSGFLVPTKDPAEFARKANVIINDAPLAAQLAKEARDRTVTNFRSDTMCRQLFAVYEDVAARRTSAA